MGLFTTYMGLNKSSSSKEETVLRELQVNGEDVNDEDDFTIDDEDEAVEDVEQGETPEDAADNAADENVDIDDDFTLDEEDGATEDTEANEIPDAETNEDVDDDFTLDDEAGDDAPEDNGENANVEETPAEDNATEGEDDFTMDDNAGDDGGENNAEGNDDQNQNQDQKAQPNAEKTSPNPTDNISDEDARAAEEQIYYSLTDDQKRIRLLQLKIDYKDLYETAVNTIEGINGIPKNNDNIETIKRLTEFIEKSKNILIDYVENNFDKNSYLENYTTYIKFLAIFRTVTKVMDEMNKVKDMNKR